jgi:hypothetical protein
MNVRLLLSTLLAVTGMLGTTHAAAVARFMHVDGAVSVRDVDNRVRDARRGDRLNEKETVVIGEGRAQLRFDDGGWVSLQPRTVFEVSEYSPKSDGSMLLRLIKGSARAVTGLLADAQPRRYQFTTPVATVGIRGTSFQVTYCLQSCDVPDGLYVTGGDGTIFVRNGFGEIDLSRGRTAFVATAQTPPRESDVKPTPQVTETLPAEQITVATQANPTELRPGNFVYNVGTGGYVGPFETVAVTSFGLAAAASGTFSGQASSLVGNTFNSASGTASGADAIGGTVTLHGGETMTVVLDSLRRPFSMTVVGADGSRVSASALNAPAMSDNDGILFWGRWTDATFNFDLFDAVDGGTANGSATIAGHLHYMVGVPVATVPASGSATYTFFGGTGSSSSAGLGTGVTAGSLIANFGSNQITASGITIDHLGAIYMASGSVARFESANRAGFSTNIPGGSAANTTGAGSFPFRFEGFFAGSGTTVPSRAGIGWKIDAPAPIVGGAGFRCASGC